MAKVSVENTSDLEVIGMAATNLVFESTIVRIYLSSLCDKGVMGPMRSKCNSSNGLAADEDL